MPEKSTEPQQNAQETAGFGPPVSRATERQRSEAVVETKVWITPQPESHALREIIDSTMVESLMVNF